MDHSKELITNLREQGERITPLRREIVRFFVLKNTPLSALEIQYELSQRGIQVNKTSIYRQLVVLQRYNIIHEVHFRDRTKRYELIRGGDHHHHLVCVRCKNVEDINFKDDLNRQEKIILQKNKFTVFHHSLEFFGLCQKCVRKKKNK